MNTQCETRTTHLPSTSIVGSLERFSVSDRSCLDSVKCPVACGPLSENRRCFGVVATHSTLNVTALSS
jgi:hypothetical protein